MIKISQCKVPVSYTEDLIKEKVSKLLKCQRSDILKVEVAKESLDARQKPLLHYSLTLLAEVKDEKKVMSKIKNKDIQISKKEEYKLPQSDTISQKKVAVIGAGPAGLVCAYYLAKAGANVVLLERGKCVEERMQDVQLFWEKGELNPESNVQFGEGGAGTFSDGKLNTLIKDKFGRCKEVLKLFVSMGAPEDILYKQKPHVGTDLLIDMVRNIRNSLIQMGAKVLFDSKVTGFDIVNDKIEAAILTNGEKITADAYVLAIGHSARDTFEMLYEAGIPMSAKDFAVGYRVMHPQAMIDESQYGIQPQETLDILGSASYKLTHQALSGRGVYSFCMCPGGYVVNASSEENRLAINGMSYHDRASGQANSAIIMTVTQDDYQGDGPLAGMYFQRSLEEKAYQLADGKMVLQRLEDYRENKATETEVLETIPVCVKGAYVPGNIRGVLPTSLEEAFLEGMNSFGRKIKGFDDKDTLINCVESRTSSPIRIHRDECAVTMNNLYPCGEGAGYAGGITSAAMDGLYIAEAVIKNLSQSTKQ